MPKNKRPISALVVLVLVANSAFHLRSWWMEDNGGRDGGRRQLNTQYDRTYRGLKMRGYEPGTARFDRALRDRMRRRTAKTDNMKKNGKRRVVARNLKESKEIWLRGDFLESRGKMVSNTWNREPEVRAAAEAAEIFEEKRKIEVYEPLTICDRPADVGENEDITHLQQYSQCSEITQDKPILLLEGKNAHGRTGNNLIEFLHAIQEARDQDIQLGIMAHSWAMHLLLKMFMAIETPDWISEFERTFCVKIFEDETQLEGWDIIHKETKDLFHIISEIPLGEYIESQEHSLRTLFRNYNTGGEGRDRNNQPVNDMCSGIKSIFGEDQTAIYSVIHSRALEGVPGFRLLANVARKSGCDKVAALEMRPDYIKSILEPLGMMNYPIVFITDGQNSAVLERLMADPDIAPLIQSVPEEASWVGGDLTLAVMSSVFIGNPASSFSGFIAKARLALGLGHNYLFRAKDENSE